MVTNFKHCLRDCFSLLFSQFLKAHSPDKQIPTVCSRHSRRKKNIRNFKLLCKFTQFINNSWKAGSVLSLQLMIQMFILFTNLNSISSCIYARKKEIPDYFFKASLFDSIAVLTLEFLLQNRLPLKLIKCIFFVWKYPSNAWRTSNKQADLTHQT